MQLCRLATVRLTRPPPFSLGRWDYTASNGLVVTTANLEGVEIDLTNQQTIDPGQEPVIAWPYEHMEVRLSVSVITGAGPLEIIDGRLVVPVEPRLRSEAAIREFADMLSLAHQCRRVIRSPLSCVALSPANTVEEEIFANVRELRQPDVGRVQARLMPPVIPGELLEGLRDRLDGLALIADSLAEDGAIGRCRELFRLFERGFRRSAGELVEPLTTFLRSNPKQHVLGYDRDEVAHWLQYLRGRSVHADKRPTVSRSSDIEPFLGRMECAAYDVLFNKADWRHPSATRREQQAFMSGVSSDRKQTLLFHPGGTLLQEWIDPFGIFPIDHVAKTNFPAGWLWRFSGQ